MVQKELINSIKELISIESVESAAKENMPFGQGVYNALNYFLKLAKSFGFKTNNYDNYIGEVIFGQGEEIAILCHLDTVPAGNGWTYPPFTATEENGKIYGRGAMDDKSAAIICLYALKELKNENFKPNKCIKLIVGCDEESGWKCIEHYKKVAKMPETGFSPDADFPVIYAEKGILHFDILFNFDKNRVKSFIGGNAPNMVCDYAEAIFDIDESQLKEYNFKKENGKIISEGKSSHGSTPQLGNNAIEPIVKYLADNELIDKDAYRILFDKDFELKKLNDETGFLTLSPDIVKIENNNIVFTVDIRYPSTIKLKEITDILDKTEKTYKILTHQPPLFNDIESPLIKTLLKVYNDVLGVNEKPIAIGGGTYARALKHGVAFGPEFTNEVSTVHQKNEYIEINKIDLLFKIYYKAIKELIK
jgi:succinyl-diaminopimelate desuccinylase